MDSFTLSDVIPATPTQIFQAWLTGDEHAAFTGSPATAEPMAGAPFTAWDGYIEGTTLELEPNRRILQSWRTTEFPSGAENSLLEVLLVGIPEGTRITLNHNRIPDGQGESYLDGWKSYYFAPLKRHFGAAQDSASAKATPPKASRPKRSAPKAKLAKAAASKHKPAKAKLAAKQKAKAAPKRKAKAVKARAAVRAKPARKQAKKPARKPAPARRAKRRGR